MQPHRVSYITGLDLLKYSLIQYYLRVTMLEIHTSFYPYQLALYRRSHVELRLKIKNTGNEKTLVSFKLELPGKISLDKSGFKGMHSEKLGEMQPRQAIEKRFEIHPRPLAQHGSVAIAITATEHYNNYEFTMKDYKKKVEL